MRSSVAFLAAGLVAAACLGACTGAEDDCGSDADCPAGSRCVKNGEHRVCLEDGGPCPAGDADGDGACDDGDNCPASANPGQADADGDGAGDACDPCPADPADDADGDGRCANADNCPVAANPGQEDADGDGAGDACDPCPADPVGDADGDGVCGDADNCPAVANPGQEDADGDGAGDACDACPRDSADDADGDGVCADGDNCPETPNAGQENLDGDGFGDVCDADVDGDGAPEAVDCAPRDPAVYPGAPDPCDGVDTDCVPGRCALGFDPAAEGWAVRDVTCAPGTRMCAVALRGAGEAGQPETLGTIAVEGVRGVAIDPRHASGPMVWAISGQSLACFMPNAQHPSYELVPESPTLSGNVAIANMAVIGAAAHSTASYLQFFSPAAINAPSSIPNPSCGSSSAVCRISSLKDLTDGNSPLGLRALSSVTVRQDPEDAPAQVYSTAEGDSRIAIAVIGLDGVVHASYSGLVSTGLSHPPFLTLARNGSLLFAIDRLGNGVAISTAARAVDHVVEGFSLPSCPTALLARDNDLLVASHCEGAEPELITLPVTDGLPDASAAVHTPLPNCVPLRMVESPRLGTDGADVVLLGCHDTATVLVLGRD